VANPSGDNDFAILPMAQHFPFEPKQTTEFIYYAIPRELIYIDEFEDGQHLNQEVKNWINRYNHERLY
jgi:hypothetical protein